MGSQPCQVAVKTDISRAVSVIITRDLIPDVEDRD
jgi:hypothetical protein